jgi:hypothetical protein
VRRYSRLISAINCAFCCGVRARACSC